MTSAASGREPGVVENAKALETACFLPPGSSGQGWRERNGAVGEVRIIQEEYFYH